MASLNRSNTDLPLASNSSVEVFTPAKHGYISLEQENDILRKQVHQLKDVIVTMCMANSK